MSTFTFNVNVNETVLKIPCASNSPWTNAPVTHPLHECYYVAQSGCRYMEQITFLNENYTMGTLKNALKTLYFIQYMHMKSN